jgi:unsaturated rhamnogalacturonyl hydrolase
MSLAGEAFGAETEGRLRAAAERLLQHPFQAWFYGDSVGFEGLLAASELLDDVRYRDFARGFLRGWAARDEPRGADDNTAPGLVLCEIAGAEADDELGRAARRLADYLASRRRVRGVALTFEDASRSLREPYGEGRLDDAEHELLQGPGAGVYVDCLHFDPPFYAALAKLEADPGWASRAIEEASGYVDLLQDRESGLFDHFWLERTGRSYAQGWGRGQGWAALGLLDVLERVDDNDDARPLTEAVQALLEAMLRTQREQGSWFAMVHEPLSGSESSTAAFMVPAFLRAARMGIGDTPVLREAAGRAWRALLAQVDATGLFNDVSAAVYSSTLDSHYHHVPRGFDVPWGQGALLIAALEVTRG